MSQTAILYRISAKDIQESITYPEKVSPSSIISVAKSNIELGGSFVALEYLLTKRLPSSDHGMIREIFSPAEILGEPLDEASDDYLHLFEMLESGKSVPYMDKQKVGLICSILDGILSADIEKWYDADELNREYIYPRAWHNNNDAAHRFNSRHLITDFELLKHLFALATKEGDSIISVIS